LTVPAIALGLYAKIGRPNLPDMPLQARTSAPAAQPDLSAVVGKMEAYIAAQPTDGHALELMAPAYLRMGRYDDAVNAIKKAIDILGETPDRLVSYAEALSYANDGMVSPDAVDQLEHALALDPKNLQARYFLGLARPSTTTGTRRARSGPRCWPRCPTDRGQGRMCWTS